MVSRGGGTDQSLTCPDSYSNRSVSLLLDPRGAPADIHASQLVPKSAYQRRLELEDQGLEYDSEEEGEEEEENAHKQRDAPSSSSKAAESVSSTQQARSRGSRRYRFWSDFSRTYFHPKSLVTVGGQLMSPMSGSTNAYPATASEDEQDGRTRFETFAQGRDYFKQLETEHDVLDENIRWFAEDSDLLQGLSYTISTSDAFGGLGRAYLEALVDEFPKLAHLVFAPSWGDDVETEDGGNRLARIRRMNNALALAELAEYSTILVPIRAPSSQANEQGWKCGIDRVDLEDMHHASALIAAHLETATLGSR